MVFSSTIFLFVFLPALFILYFLAPRITRNYILLLASLIFYAWGEGFFVLIMIFSVVFNHFAGIWIDRYRTTQYSKLILTAAVIGNLLLLGTFKYYSFILENVNILFPYLGIPTVNFSPIHLPIGISFFSFQAISYIVDVYRKAAPVETNLSRTALYISLFPQLVAGPIIRYHDIAAQLVKRTTTLSDFSYGIRRFVIGLAKKVLIADSLGHVTDQVFTLPSSDLTTSISWLGIICFTLQIYYDFSAYSDMAIGLGRMLGFKFLENFNYPYIARTYTEIWTRWHISFTNWIREYLFRPLGGVRGTKLRISFNIFIVFILSGLWHGASWTFILWGMLQGLTLTLEAAGIKKLVRRLPRSLGTIYVMFIWMNSLVLFRSSDIASATTYYSRMYYSDSYSALFKLSYFLTPEVLFFIFIGIIGCAPFGPWLNTVLSNRRLRFGDPYKRKLITGQEIVTVSFYASILLASLAYLFGSSYSPFIYFRF